MERLIKKADIVILRIVCIILCVCLFGYLIYLVLPRLFAESPVLEEIYPGSIVEKTVETNDSISIYLKGSNLDGIIAVYINNDWIKECDIEKISDDTLKLTFARSQFGVEGRYDIQVQKKCNSDDILKMSNRIRFSVMKRSVVKKTKLLIRETFPETLSDDGGFYTIVHIKGDNFDENSVVLVNGEAVVSLCSNGSIDAYIPFYFWYGKSNAEIKVCQYYEGFPSSIESNSVKVPCEYNVRDLEDIRTSGLLEDELFTEYLDKASKSNVCLFISVREGGNNCLYSADIESKLNEINLKKYKSCMIDNSNYLAVIDSGSVVYENNSKYNLYKVGGVDSIKYRMLSGKDDSIIKINGTDCSLDLPGVNVVTYDKDLGIVIDRVNFRDEKTFTSYENYNTWK